MSPQTRAALGLAATELTPPRPVARVMPEPDSLVGLAVLMRVQRRLAIRTMSVLLGGLFLIPLVIALAIRVDTVRIMRIPIVWLILGAAIYPALWLLAAHHRCAVDRLDIALADRATRGSR